MTEEHRQKIRQTHLKLAHRRTDGRKKTKKSLRKNETGVNV